jgi:hypothetical protein
MLIIIARVLLKDFTTVPPKIAINLVFKFHGIVGMTCINTIETLQSAL